MSDIARIPVSVIIPVKNEAVNIWACVGSVGWADEVFVIDSHSTDGTADLAKAAGAQVVQFDYRGGWPKKKNWALRNLPLRNEWVLILDADERITPELRDEIAAAIKDPGCNGFYVRWKFIFLSRWMKHSWSHGWMLRLLRRGRGEYEDLGMRGEGGWDNEVHENIVVQGTTRRLQSLLLHESGKDLSAWIRKQNEFSDWNAARRLQQLKEPFPPMADLASADPLKRRRWLKALYLRLPGKPLLMFVYLYFARLGFLDGIAGFFFCALRSMHELNTSAKLYELRLRAK
jgi:glycosyltransferase involved in cell wall biosynthesis